MGFVSLLDVPHDTLDSQGRYDSLASNEKTEEVYGRLPCMTH